MDKPYIRIGTRGSDLALWQANHVKTRLESLGCVVSINIIQTQGDRIQDLSFDKLEGKGFFTKEIEHALLQGEVDLAVHSHKDLETTPPPGLVIAAVSEREDPSELLLIRNEAHDSSQPFELKEGARIGTSSARRQSLLRTFRSDLQIEELRGNVPTRIEKLRSGQYDAILLAKAGVSRLNLDTSDLITLTLNPKEFVPAPAQGVLGLQVRSTDNHTYAWVRKLNYELSENVFGVISTRAAYLMNGMAGDDNTHPPVAMTGRVPVQVIGYVAKGDRLVSAGNGVARAAQPGEATAFNVLGRALAHKRTPELGEVEAIVTISK